MSEIQHTLEKINGVWYVWNGDPRLLRAADAIAGPFAKRYQAMQAAQTLALKAALPTDAH